MHYHNCAEMSFTHNVYVACVHLIFLIFFTLSSPLQSAVDAHSPTHTNVWHLEPAQVLLVSRRPTLWMWCDAACRLQESPVTRTAPSWARWGRSCQRRGLSGDSTKVSVWTGSKGPSRWASASPPLTLLRSSWGSCIRWAIQPDSSDTERQKTGESWTRRCPNTL